MRDMYFASQPMEREDMISLECTFRMINAETQLMYASDYPHWDFDLPSTVWDLPFLSEKAKPSPRRHRGAAVQAAAAQRAAESQSAEVRQPRSVITRDFRALSDPSGTELGPAPPR
jgi:hypothetical protein